MKNKNIYIVYEEKKNSIRTRVIRIYRSKPTGIVHEFVVAQEVIRFVLLSGRIFDTVRRIITMLRVQYISVIREIRIFNNSATKVTVITYNA